MRKNSKLILFALPLFNAAKVTTCVSIRRLRLPGYARTKKMNVLSHGIFRAVRGTRNCVTNSRVGGSIKLAMTLSNNTLSG